MHQHFLTLILASLIGPASAQTTATIMDQSTFLTNYLSPLIIAARDYSPALRMNTAEVARADADAAGAAALPPPLFTVASGSNPFSNFRERWPDQGEIEFSLEQEFPFPAKVRLERADAAHAAAAARAGAETLRIDESAAVVEAFWSAYAADRSAAILAERRILLAELAPVLKKRYETNDASYGDILALNNEKVLLVVDSAEIASQATDARASLLAGCGRAAEGLPSILPACLPDTAAIDLAALETRYLAAHPALKAQRESILAAESAEQRGRLEAMPDFMARGSVATMPGMQESSWSLMAGLTLPFAPWAKRGIQAAAAGSAADLRRAQAENDDIRRTISRDIASAAAQFESARRALIIHETIVLPQTRQAFEAGLASFRAKSMEWYDLKGLLDSWFDERERVNDAMVGFQTARGNLARAAGLSDPGALK